MNNKINKFDLKDFVLRFTYKNPNKKFTVRQLADGIGIWRIK